MRNRNVSNQVPATVSLADAPLIGASPIHLREAAAILRALPPFWVLPGGETAYPRNKAEWLDALASSLEQIQQPSTTVEPGGLDVKTLGTESGRWLPMENEAQSTNNCSNEDTVTITLSREQAYVLHQRAFEVEIEENHRSKAHENEANIALWKGIRIALQPTPERRE